MDQAPVTMKLATIALIVATGCSMPTRTINTTQFGPAKKILVYDGGTPVIERVVAPESNEERAIAAWLRAHPDRWQTDVNTYVPVNYACGDGFSINFTKYLCILNYQSNETRDWTQVVRSLGPDDAPPDVFLPVSKPR